MSGRRSKAIRKWVLRAADEKQKELANLVLHALKVTPKEFRRAARLIVRKAVDQLPRDVVVKAVEAALPKEPEKAAETTAEEGAV